MKLIICCVSFAGSYKYFQLYTSFHVFAFLVQTSCTMLQSKRSDLSDMVLESMMVLMKMSPEC